MRNSTPDFADSDIRFLVETVLPDRTDKERLVDMVLAAFPELEKKVAAGIR